MSYSIVYDKKFVKTGNGIIPIILSGDSNCWTTTCKGRDVRTRSWGVFRFAEMPMPAEKLMAEVEKLVPSTYNEHFKYNGRWVDDKMFVSFFQSGIKNALTLEELMEKYIVSGLRVEVCSKDLNSDKEYPPTLTLVSKTCRTNGELEEALALAVTTFNAQPKEAYPYFRYSFGYENERLKTRVKKRRGSGSTPESGYLLRLTNGSYFIRRSSRRMWFSEYVGMARHFRSKEEAERYCLEHLGGYKEAKDAVIVAKKLVLRTPRPEKAPYIHEYWTGHGFAQAKAFAKPFPTAKQAETEKNLPGLAGTDVEIAAELFEAGTVSRKAPVVA